jgi:hypothetical protein
MSDLRELIVTALMNAWPGCDEGITGAEYGWYHFDDATIKGWFYHFPDVWNWMREWNCPPDLRRDAKQKFPGRSRLHAFLHTLPDRALLCAYDQHCCQLYR